MANPTASMNTWSVAAALGARGDEKARARLAGSQSRRARRGEVPAADAATPMADTAAGDLSADDLPTRVQAGERVE